MNLPYTTWRLNFYRSVYGWFQWKPTFFCEDTYVDFSWGLWTLSLDDFLKEKDL
jgi:hypothetical protein